MQFRGHKKVPQYSSSQVWLPGTSVVVSLWDTTSLLFINHQTSRPTYPTAQFVYLKITMYTFWKWYIHCTLDHHSRVHTCQTRTEKTWITYNFMCNGSSIFKSAVLQTTSWIPRRHCGCANPEVWTCLILEILNRK